jgi:N-methylhydantoinase B
MAIVEKGAVDEVTLSVVWNRMLTYIYECGERVMISAQSLVMAFVRDLGPVLLTPDGDIIVSGDFLPHHTLIAEIPTKHIIKKFGKLEPGDMVLANDAHIIQSSHMLDWTCVIPIYYKDELVFYGHFKGHVLDSGGAYQGGYFPGTYDCYGEGLNIPPLKIYKKGVLNEDVRELILNNNRTPAAVWADFELIRGSLLRLADNIVGLIDRYGLDTMKGCVQEMIRRDEIATRRQIRGIPDGVYYGESAVDWDGTTPDKQVFVRVKLTVKGDEMTFDFSDSDDQVDFVNVPLGLTHACTLQALFWMFDATIPHNHGVRIPVHIIAPPGKVVNPTRPHTYGGCACNAGTQVTEACNHALAQAMPERAMGDWSRHFAANASGRLPEIDPRTSLDREFFQAPFIEEGGSGAVKGFDGWDGVGAGGGSGASKRGSVEEQELSYPVRFDVVDLMRDSEGAGEFTGARGTYVERIITIPEKGARYILQTGDCTGDTWPAFGVAGAPKLPLSSMRVIRAGKKRKEVIKAIDLNELYSGDVLYTRCYGAGGWGNPLDRDPEKVKTNVMEGLLSLNRARKVYGVVLNQKDKENAETIEVNYPATRELRKKLRKSDKKDNS